MRKSIASWWLMLPIGIALIAILPRVLPPQYFFDAESIREHIATAATGFVLGESFANTAYLYRVLGIGDAPRSAAYVTYLAAWTAVLIALALSNNGGRFVLLLPFFVWHTILVAFTGMYSKEVHAMPALALLLVLAGDRFTLTRVVTMAVIVIGYSLLFRKYWGVVGALAAAFIIVRHRRILPLPGGVAMLGIFFAMLVAYHIATGEYLTDWRNTLTEGRDLDLFSDTAFANALPPTSLLADFGNAMVALVQLLLPVNMLVSGKLQHAAFALWEILNVVVFGVLIARVWRSDHASARLVFAAAWVVAFTLTQSTFEPDYGTFLRHQATLLPLLAYIALETLWVREPRQRWAPGYVDTSSGTVSKRSLLRP
ncbi:MAG TPA: hypothetical protein VNG69_04785 [Casimicrobiaceae bacterium]|nr:hypothetical protein [Casimicrobiaceae bacterium]